MSVDRVDEIAPGLLRFIDFKSGNDETSLDIQPLLHPLRQLAAATPIKPLSINKKPLTSYRSVRDTFRPLLVKLIDELFNPDTPFVQCSDTSSCEYCPFLSLCARNVKKY